MNLPITAILPARNAMAAIGAHAEAIREWLPHVAQVVVVDSSEDGTLDFLRSEIGLPNVEFHSRPRGLYESWNFGVRQAREEFVYFSTIGDIITLDGLKHLLEVGLGQGADIVISPPEMFDSKGTATPDVRWPIHDLCAEMVAGAVQTLTAEQAFILSASYVPATILGSSASNLYRREFLTAQPFPEGWAHCADSLWIIAHCLKASIAVTNRSVARFVVHEREAVPGAKPTLGLEHYEDMLQRARLCLKESTLPDAEKHVLAGWLSALERRYLAFFERLEAHTGYLARRDARIKELGERVTAARDRAVGFENQLKASNQKVIDLRNQLWNYQRIHRSLPRLVRLYLSVKWQQLQKLLAPTQQQ